MNKNTKPPPPSKEKKWVQLRRFTDQAPTRKAFGALVDLLDQWCDNEEEHTGETIIVSHSRTTFHRAPFDAHVCTANFFEQKYHL